MKYRRFHNLAIINFSYSSKTRAPISLLTCFCKFSFSDCCWEALNEKNNNNNNKENTDKEKAKWMLWTTVDVTQNSSDANHSHQVINSSPVTNFQPVIYAITDCENEIKIPGKFNK